MGEGEKRRRGKTETFQIPKSPKYLNYLKTEKDKAVEEKKSQNPNTKSQTISNNQIPITQIKRRHRLAQMRLPRPPSADSQ